MVRRSKTLLLGSSFVTPWRVWCLSLSVPRPRSGNATRLSHRHGLGSSRFARRYSGSRCCFLFLGVLRCFNSPGSLYRSYVFRPEYRSHAAVGFPIRTSTDQSLVGSSPWLIAATHVLHRLQAPRHPPLALCSLENKDARARYGILKGRRTRPSQRQRAVRTGKRSHTMADSCRVHRGRGRPLSGSAFACDTGAMLLVNGTELVRPDRRPLSEDKSCQENVCQRGRVASDQLGVAEPVWSSK
jgi:hypothetical protein